MILTLNKTQNNLQLIKLENGFVIVDLKASKTGYFLVTTNNSIGNDLSLVEPCGDLPKTYKIIFASQFFNLENVKVIEEDNIEKLVEIIYGYRSYKNKERKEDFIEGYKKAKENTYTLEQLKEAMNYGKYWMKLHTDVAHQEFIDSLNQPSVEIFFDENNIPLTAKFI